MPGGLTDSRGEVAAAPDLSLVAPRHSAAAVPAGRNEGGRRSIAFAFVANVVVAAAKLAAGVITGSSALLAEALHSAADSVNEALLGLSLQRGRQPADAKHPFGYGGTAFCGCRW
jgi:divalent metal cation (Fe/Co/Zn/Cd) transporter